MSVSLVPPLQRRNTSILPIISAIVGANPCVRPVFPHYSGVLHGQARGPTPTAYTENQGRYPCAAL
ncbi:MAG: hypothetical protein V8K32_13880 [Candidatus Electrothrix gigas]